MTAARAVGIVLCSALLSACATGSSQTAMSTDEVIAARQKHMKEQGAAMRSISDKLKGGQVQAVEADAQKLAQSAKDLPKLYPAGSLNAATSRAKPEIWQKKAEFDGYAKTLETKAATVASTARTGDGPKTQAAVADMGKTTCTACHDAFRGPEIKK